MGPSRHLRASPGPWSAKVAVVVVVVVVVLVVGVVVVVSSWALSGRTGHPHSLWGANEALCSHQQTRQTCRTMNGWSNKRTISVPQKNKK